MRAIYFLFFLTLPYELNATPLKNEGHGKVFVNGQILTPACSIHTDDIWQEILFDAHSPRTIRNNGKQNVQQFSLRLVNCQLKRDTGGEWQSVYVTFDGMSSLNDASLFSVSGNAKGVALKIIDDTGELAIPGKSMSNISLREGGNILGYTMQVVLDGSEFVEGNWFASLRFMVAYQ